MVFRLYQNPALSTIYLGGDRYLLRNQEEFPKINEKSLHRRGTETCANLTLTKHGFSIVFIGSFEG